MILGLADGILGKLVSASQCQYPLSASAMPVYPPPSPWFVAGRSKSNPMDDKEQRLRQLLVNRGKPERVVTLTDR